MYQAVEYTQSFTKYQLLYSHWWNSSGWVPWINNGWKQCRYKSLHVDRRLTAIKSTINLKQQRIGMYGGVMITNSQNIITIVFTIRVFILFCGVSFDYCNDFNLILFCCAIPSLLECNMAVPKTITFHQRPMKLRVWIISAWVCSTLCEPPCVRFLA